MQRFGHLRDLHQLAYSLTFRTAGQVRCCCQVPDDASQLPLPLSSTLQEQIPAYYSSTTTPSQQCKTTALVPPARAAIASSCSASTLCLQPAPASAGRLISMPACKTLPQLGPAAAMHCNQIHTSASKQEPSPVEPHQSKPASLPESAAGQSGPDISLLNAVQQRQWDHASNAHLGHIVIKPKSSRKACWTCSRCPQGLPHHWTAKVTDIYRSSKSKDSGCPYCSGRAVCPHNSLAQRAPHLITEWDSLRNVDTPQDYTSKSAHHAHWVCADGHHWQARLIDRVHRNRGCPDCAKARSKSRGVPLTKSSGSILKVWDHAENTKAGLDPSQLTCGSNKRAHFKCPQKHQWTARIQDVVSSATTIACPTCRRFSAHKLSH